MILDQKVAIVTGASRGIGRAVAIGFAQQGASIVVNYLMSSKEAQEVVDQIKGMGGKAIKAKTDISKKDEVETMVQTTLESFGKIDILINNSGIRTQFFVEGMREEDWDLVIDTNLKGTFLCCQAVIPSMKKQQSGRILNFSSGRGLGGMAGGAHYSASKAGIIGFTRSLALELAPYGINVNTIIPGPIDTSQWRTGKSEAQIEKALEDQKLSNPLLIKVKKPEEVVGTILFLVSDASRSITGQTISMETP